MYNSADSDDNFRTLAVRVCPIGARDGHAQREMYKAGNNIIVTTRKLDKRTNMRLDFTISLVSSPSVIVVVGVVVIVVVVVVVVVFIVIVVNIYSYFILMTRCSH